MEVFKVGSLMNLISGKSGSTGSTGQPAEQNIVFKQKSKVASANQLNVKKVEKSFDAKNGFKQQSNQGCPKSQNGIVKKPTSNSSVQLQGKFRRGTLNKSFKNLKMMQGSKPVVAETLSGTVVGKSFKYINSENSSSTEKDTTDGNPNDDKLERTVFVGNLPLTNISDNAITKLFAQFGGIESFRLRSVPLKDLRVSKKVAAIKADFHPDRTNTNAYVVMKSKEAAKAALALNGTVLDNHHLRVDKVASEESDPRKAIFLGNVSFKAEEDDLWALFERCGEIDYVRILRDKTTSVSKGAAYVNFKSADSVELALKMEGTAEIHGRLPKIHRCLPGRRKSLHVVSSRQPGPRNTDETNDDKARSKEEKRFQKKMKRREKREAENAKNEALGVRSRPLKEPSTSESTAKSFVGVKAEDQKQKRKKKRSNKGDLQRKKVAKILANVKSEVTKHEKSPEVVDIGSQPNSATSKGDVTPAPQDSTKKTKKLGKVMKKAAPKTILLEQQGEIRKKKLKKFKQ